MAKFEELSIFFPFWNEQDNVESVVQKAIVVAEKVAKRWEIIMIDDGSSDKTFEKIKKLAINDERLIPVSHKVNRGYGAALKTGFEKARYDYVVFNDGDGQFDFSELTRLMEKVENAKKIRSSFQTRLNEYVKDLGLYIFWFQIQGY